jgi:hypothetical protein
MRLYDPFVQVLNFPDSRQGVALIILEKFICINILYAEDYIKGIQY